LAKTTLPWRGVLCLLLLPWHTLVLATAALLAAVFQPRGHAFLVPGRWWCRAILATAGVRVHVQPGSGVTGGPYVIVANHQSHFDIPALVQAWPGPFRMVAKRSLFYIPILGWAMWMGGFIAIDRSHRQSAIASLSRAVQEIRRGTSVVLFAEGTRSHDGNLQALKKGPFRLAQQAGVPVLPVTISGSRNVLPRQRWFPRRGTIDVVLGAPLESPSPDDTVDEIMRAAADALQSGYTARHQMDLEHPGEADTTDS